MALCPVLQFVKNVSYSGLHNVFENRVNEKNRNKHQSGRKDLEYISRKTFEIEKVDYVEKEVFHCLLESVISISWPPNQLCAYCIMQI